MCGAVYLAERPTAAGEVLDPIVCTAHPQYDAFGKPRLHRGKHRTRLPGGVRLRWNDTDTTTPETPADRKAN